MCLYGVVLNGVIVLPSNLTLVRSKKDMLVDHLKEEYFFGRVVQLEEHRTDNSDVASSNLALPTTVGVVKWEHEELWPPHERVQFPSLTPKIAV